MYERSIENAVTGRVAAVLPIECSLCISRRTLLVGDIKKRMSNGHEMTMPGMKKLFPTSL
jgi:hypothetical protein